MMPTLIIPNKEFPVALICVQQHTMIFYFILLIYKPFKPSFDVQIYLE